jgi:hypothetical protein
VFVRGSFFPLAMSDSSRSTRKMMSIGGPSRRYVRMDGRIIARGEAAIVAGHRLDLAFLGRG